MSRIAPGHYRLGRLDPRPGEAARAANAGWLGERTLGVEVTVPALAARCGLGNLDPQHGGEAVGAAAIELSLGVPLPPDGACLVTVRPDLDALGAMAVFVLRRQGVTPDAAMRGRVALIARADRFARGSWPGPRPLPSVARPVDCHAEADEIALAAIAGCVADAALAVDRRVAAVGRWLRSGAEPDGYRAAWLARRRALAALLAAGALRLEYAGGGRIAVVVSEQPHVLSLGYRLAPVVVAVNERFRLEDGPPHRKLTIAQFTTGYLDLPALARSLSQWEPGWGGGSAIIGSPQGAGTRLALGQVIGEAERLWLDRRLQ